MTQMNTQISLTDNSDQQWKRVLMIGAVTTTLALIGIILDIIIGTATGGNLTALPQTAVDRFVQFQNNPLLGLYNLDLLNVINQIILIPTYIALLCRPSKDAEWVCITRFDNLSCRNNNICNN